MKLKYITRLKVTFAFVLISAVFGAFLLRSGAVTLFLFTFPLIFWLGMIYVLEEVGENFAVLQVVDEENGVVHSRVGLIQDVFEKNQRFVVETDSFVVSTPVLAKGKTNFLFGLPEVFLFVTNQRTVEEKAGKLYAVATVFSEAEREKHVRDVLEDYVKVKRELRNSYPSSYVRTLEKQVEKMREQFEKSVLVGVKAVQGVSMEKLVVKHPVPWLMFTLALLIGLLLGVWL